MRVSPTRRFANVRLVMRALRHSCSLALLAVIAGGLAACATERTAAPSAAGATKPASDQLVAAPQSRPLPPSAAPATGAGGLQVIDHQVGTGKEAQAGKAALVQYTGWLYDEKAPDHKGKQFDSSSASRSGLPFGFIVGVGKVIKGWDQGVPGMKVGGKRTLIVPAQLAYGDKDVGNGLIPPNSTLVFDIELVDVKP
jgi:FKBP-type peptidyl-prolyl cis-trans isomerase FkpA